MVVIHDNRNERLERELAAQRPQEVLGAEKKHEVGDAEAIREVEGVKEGAHKKRVEGVHPAAHPHVGKHR